MIGKEGKEKVQWTVAAGQMPNNIVVSLSKEELTSINNKPKGLQRVTQLFRVVKNCVIPRFVIATVAGQEGDPVELVGHARIALRSEGIIILGHEADDRKIAGAMGLPEFSEGDFYSMHPTWRSTVVE